MCGRYASARKRIELLEEFSVQRDETGEALQPDYNVAPTKPVYAVVERAGPPAGEDADVMGADAPSSLASGASDVARELRVMRWGLVPFWARDARIGSRMINARAETVAEKPAFRRAFARRRCLLPADGYYEWQPLPGGGKQPVYISRRDGGCLAFAGLYELWRDPAVAADDPSARVWTTTIITTSAPDELGMIHDRMPMIIDEASWADWLNPGDVPVSDLRALLQPAMVSELTTWPVATLVNSVRHNGPQLIEPVTAEPAVAPPPAHGGAGGIPPGAGGIPPAAGGSPPEGTRTLF